MTMRIAKVFVCGKEAGHLTEITLGKKYKFEYLDGYQGTDVSLTMPINRKVYIFDRFPSFFDGLLPKG